MHEFHEVQDVFFAKHWSFCSSFKVSMKCFLHINSLIFISLYIWFSHLPDWSVHLLCGGAGRYLITGHCQHRLPALQSAHLQPQATLRGLAFPHLHVHPPGVCSPWGRHHVEILFSLLAICEGSPVLSFFNSLCLEWHHMWFQNPVIIGSGNACSLLGAKPLSKPMVTYCRLDP